MRPVDPNKTEGMTPDKVIIPDEYPVQVQGIPLADVLKELKRVELVVGDEQYFTFGQLAVIFKVPIWYFRDQVRKGKGLHARKVGKAYICSAREFYNFIITGKLDYKERPSRKGKNTSTHAEMAKRAAKGLMGDSDDK